jgi:3-oxoacyl-[acyl-carrier-protein] synthase-3
MTLTFDSVYLTSAGSFLPGSPVDNDALDRFIVPLDASAQRVKRRVLEENGIETRHYAIDEQGRTLHSAGSMAALAVQDCLRGSGVALEEVSVLCTGSSGGDLALPGFANMVQGELAAPPMLTSSHQGVCAASMAALQHAASALSLGAHRHALVVASELPSRLFKRSRFAPREYRASYDSHFLRYMLSDGAGAWLLGRAPRARGVSLALDWVHSRSFSGDHPVCMQIGSAGGRKQQTSYLDYPSLAEAERDGALLLRQDLRLLPQLFELGVHEYVELVRAERIVPAEIDVLLCHYSSKMFEPVIDELMQKTGFAIPKPRWFSNLTWRGNTGAASLPIMLSDLLRERALEPGQRVLCFVPESGRFTVSFAQFTVVSPDAERRRSRPASARVRDTEQAEPAPVIAAPHAVDAGAERTPLGVLIAELASVWHGYQTRLWRTPLLRAITQGRLTRAEYLQWMSCWIPQVRYGSQWMRRAREQIGEPFLALRPLIAAHAHDEQDDYGILFEDYRSAGGTEPELERLRRNPGGEALNAFMFRLAEEPNPVSLLGAVYIIEGTGQRVIPALLPRLRAQLELPARAFRFLSYHGENDERHLARWLEAAEIVLAHDPQGALAESVVSTARASAELYLLQFQYVL